MELIVLGAGPAYTDRAGALGAAYLLVSGGEAIVLDLGQGTFPQLAGAWEPSRLTAVLVSHLHPDHFVDLVALRHYLRFEFDPPRRVRVVGPRGLDRRLDALHGQPGFVAASLDVEPLAVGSCRIGTFDVGAVLVEHTEESYAFRVSAADSESALVYSGDCGRADELGSFIRPGDTLLTEVSFGPGPVPAGASHLDGPMVGALAAATRPRRVLLTHLQMGYDPDATVGTVRARFDGEVSFVWPGDRLRI